MPPKPTATRTGFLQDRMAEDWQAVRARFSEFTRISPDHRFQHLGKLFEQLCPFLDSAIRGVTVRHFILLPTEMVVARMFAKTCRRESLPKSHLIFAIWVESLILRDVADPADELGATNGASGEPCAALQVRFNRLPREDRALLYLYMVEGCSVAEVSSYTGIPVLTAARNLKRVWRQVTAGQADLPLPRGWQAPELAAADLVHEDRGGEGSA